MTPAMKNRCSILFRELIFLLLISRLISVDAASSDNTAGVTLPKSETANGLKHCFAPLRSGRLPLDLPELRAAVAAGLGISLEGEAITFENARPDRNLTLELSILNEKIRRRGGRFTISGEARLEQVTVGERPYFCAKLQPCLVQKDGKVIYATLLPTAKGSRDWFPFRRSCTVPPGVTKATLMLGLQNCTGKLQYRNLVIEEEAD